MPPDFDRRSYNPVRFSRTITLTGAVALGASVSVGLGVFVLLGQFVRLTGLQSVGLPYLILALISIPLILTFTERAIVVPGNTLDLARSGGKLWTIYGSGWLMLGGYACLTALLGWGVALHLKILLEYFTQWPVDLPLLAAAIIGLLSLNNILGVRETWKSRGTLTYIGLLFLLVLAVSDFLGTTDASVAFEHWLRNTDRVMNVTALMICGLWGIYFIMNVRDEIRRPAKILLPALLLSLALGSGLGILISFDLYQDATSFPATLTPVIEAISDYEIITPNAVSTLYAIFGLSVTFITFNLILANGLQTIGTMTREGFLPVPFQPATARLQTPHLSLSVFAIAGVILVIWVPTITLAGLASLTFLWTTLLIHLPDAISRRSNLPAKRRFRLPFHPLFPWLTNAISLLLPFYLEPRVWWLGIGWVTIGSVFYAVYARRAGLTTRKQGIMVGETVTDDREAESEYRIMIFIDAKEKQPDALIKAGAKLAKARSGSLLVLKVITSESYFLSHHKRHVARQAWNDLTKLIEDLGIGEDIDIKPLVRLAPNPTGGILEAVAEEWADLLLIKWDGNHLPDETDEDPLFDPIIRHAPCDVAVVRGDLPKAIRQVLVPTDGGPNVPLALSLAQGLSEEDEGEITLAHMLVGHPSEELEAAGESKLLSTLSALENQHRIETQMIPVSKVKDGILAQAKNYDLLLIGASRDTFLEKSYFGGLPVEIIFALSKPAILTRAAETAARAWFLRVWEAFSSILPTLRVNRRAEVYRNMRTAAQPSVDFFIMITLAATIATLGLLQDSAAVIIGAMLVAPLMSPILAMAMSLVHSNLHLLVIAAESTLKGIVLAIFVGALMSIISPINAPTGQIIARTQPNVLDLLVALASGAAAGYAISRREVAAALPGVAISAALVPPLCVVGYGIGASQLTIATGAFLLFTTNLIAIVFAAGLTFLALGFHPARAGRDELIRGLQITAVSLLLVSIVLGIATIGTVTRETQRLQVESEFIQKIEQYSARVDGMTVDEKDAGFLIQATVFDFQDRQLNLEDIEQIQQDISDLIGKPVILQISIIPASQFRTRQ